MKYRWLILPVLVLAFTGCDRPVHKPLENTEQAPLSESKEDTSEDLPGENKDDLMISKNLRRALFADVALSADAQNINITTRDGIITLRGLVNNSREKSIITQKAYAVNGVNHVVDELDVRY